MLDPNTSIREAFTLDALAFNIPSNATAEFKQYAEPLRSLYEHLSYHEAMAPNLHQTYVTPAASKNRVYFMWDFVGRTYGYLRALPPTMEQGQLSAQQRELWEDVKSRSKMTCDLVLNKTPGMLNQNIEQLYPGQAHNHPDFGAEVMEDVGRLDQVCEGDA